MSKVVVACTTIAALAGGAHAAYVDPGNHPHLAYPAKGDGSEHLLLGVMYPITNGMGVGEAVCSAPILLKALEDVNARDATLCPAIGKLRNSDFKMAFSQVLDDNGQAIAAVNSAMKFMGFKQSSGATLPEPHGIVGAGYSGASMATANFLSTLKKPQVCHSSTNSKLSIKTQFPTFFRTIAPDSATGVAAARFMWDMGHRAVSVIYFDGGFASGVKNDFTNACGNPATVHGGLAKSGHSAGLEVAFSCRVDNWQEGQDPCAPPTGAQATAANLAKQAQACVALKDCLTTLHNANGAPRAVFVGSANWEGNRVFKEARKLGLMDSQPNYLWLMVDAGGMDQTRDAAIGKFEGVYVFGGVNSGVNGDILKVRQDAGEFGPGSVYFDSLYATSGALGGPLCGPDQNSECGANADFATKAQDLFSASGTGSSACHSWHVLGYDAIVAYAIAFDIGLRKGLFTRDSVTSELLLAAMKTGLSDPAWNDYGACLGPGDLILNANQDRDTPFMIKHWPKSGPNAGVVVSKISGANDDGFAGPFGNQWQTDAADGQSWKDKLQFGDQRAPSQLGWANRPTGAATNCAPGSYGVDGPHPATGASGAYCKKAERGFFVAGYGAHGQATPCSAGTFSDANGAVGCTQCAAGKHANVPLRSGCEPCGANTFSESGQDVCTACPAGKSTRGKTGVSECDDCPVGSYWEAGSAECKKCPAGTTTLGFGSEDIAACMCGAGTVDTCIGSGGEAFDGRGVDAHIATCAAGVSICKSCGAAEESGKSGPVCPGFGVFVPYDQKQDGGGSISAADLASGDACHELGKLQYSATGSVVGKCVPAPLLPQADFFVSASEPMALYDCLHSGRCAGGGYAQCVDPISPNQRAEFLSSSTGGKANTEADLQVAFPQRTGRNCAECPEGSFGGADGGCTPCKSAYFFVCLFLVALGIACAFLLYRANYRGTILRGGKFAGFLTLGMLLQTVQYLGALSAVNLRYEQPFKMLLDVANILAFNFDGLGMNCIGASDAASKQALLTFGPVVFAGALLCLCLAWGHWKNKPLNKDAYYLTVGMTWQALFIPLVLSAMRAFHCHGHGDETLVESTLIHYMELECGSGEHQSVVVFGLLGFGLYVLCPLCVLARVGMELRSSLGRRPDQFRFEFILTRFGRKRPFSPIGFLLRNLTLILIPVVMPGGPAMHVVLISLLCCASALYVAYCHPWQDSRLNFADCVTLVLIGAIAGWSCYMDDRTQEGVHVIGYSAVVACCGCVVLFIYLARQAFKDGPVFGDLEDWETAFYRARADKGGSEAEARTLGEAADALESKSRRMSATVAQMRRLSDDAAAKKAERRPRRAAKKGSTAPSDTFFESNDAEGKLGTGGDTTPRDDSSTHSAKVPAASFLERQV